MQFKEDLLQYVWQFRLFEHQGLRTQCGEPLEIIKPGLLNRDSGPDFSGAKLKIGDTEWGGNVEIHIKTSEWLLHGHQNDAAYNNVILHVVFIDDLQVRRPDGTKMPVLVLDGLISDAVFQKYEDLITTPGAFPCSKQIRSVDPVIILCLHRLS